MTTISMSSASVPVFVRMLGNLSTWIDKAQAHATAKGFNAEVFMTARLAPDMLPLPKQIQIAGDMAKGCVARLAGLDIPKYEDEEATLEELQARLKKTIEFIRSVPPEKIDGSEEREITIPVRGSPMVFKGEAYLKHFATPNMYFHVTLAYALLRHWGVELGKSDFLTGATVQV